MGLFSLNKTCWKNLLLLSTAALCSCICVLQAQFIQVIDCLTPLCPHPCFLYLADPFAWMSQKCSRRLSLLICCVLVWQMGESERSLCHNVLWKLSCPLCSQTSGMFPFVQVPSDTQLRSCVIILADGFPDYILCNNLIAIWYNNSAYSEFTEMFCWAFLVLLVPLLVHFYTLIFMVSVDWKSHSLSSSLLGLVCWENLFLHCSYLLCSIFLCLCTAGFRSWIQVSCTTINCCKVDEFIPTSKF